MLAREPVLPDYLVPWMDAWQTLNGARTFTIAAGATKVLRLPFPLAISEILAVADEYGLPRRDFLHIAQALDQVYLDHETRRA